MNRRKTILKILPQIDYIDMHLHMDQIDLVKKLNDSKILYFTNSIDFDSYHRNLHISRKFECVISSFGVHPTKAALLTISLEEINKMLKKNDFYGEIGLDFHWVEDSHSYAKQKEIFQMQLKAVKEHHSIASIHTKGAEKQVLDMLKYFDINNAIIHWYSGPLNLIEPFLELGCYFTIGPDILKDSIVYKYIPLERIFCETDNPTGVPWIRGGESTLEDIKLIYTDLQHKLQLGPEELIQKIKNNLIMLMNK